MLADKFEAIFKEAADKIGTVDFYGNDFGMDRLGYIVVPYVLRHKIRNVKSNRLKLENVPCPPRKDGGYGWFIVEETADENENSAEYSTGCNTDSDEINPALQIYYYWISKYFDYNVYHNNGIRHMLETGAIKNMTNGMIPKDALSDEDAAHFVKNNLLTLSEGNLYLNIPYFTEEQFMEFVSLFDVTDEKINDLLAEWIKRVRKNFESFVPKHLHSQINQWVNYYLYQIVGYVTDELIHRGVLSEPDHEKPLTNGVFCVEGKNINP